MLRIVQSSLRRRVSSRPLIAVVAAAVFVLIAFGLVRLVTPESSVVAAPILEQLYVLGPTSSPAGKTIEITVSAEVPDRTPVQLGVFGSLESTLLRGVIIDQKTSFLLESSLADHAGRLEVVAQVGNTRSSHSVQIVPGPAVEPIVPLVGPRTIIANTEDETMVVVSPTDQWGNPVADNTVVTTTVDRPDGTREQTDHQTRDRVAAIRLLSGSTAGRTRIASQVDGAAGPVNVVDEVAGVPAPFSITIDDQGRLADGFSLHRVSTDELVDVFGNRLPDGVASVFVVDTQRGRSFIETTVQGGVATASIQAPEKAGQVTITARVSGRASVPAEIEFLSAVSTFPVKTMFKDDELRVSVGPVVLSSGGYPADGTLVMITDPASGAFLGETALRTGRASATLDTTLSDIEVELLGAIVRTRVDRP